MSARIEAVERFFAAINRYDLEAVMREFGPEIVRGGRFADGFVLRNGKIVEYRSFAERAEALAWAGIEDPEA